MTDVDHFGSNLASIVSEGGEVAPLRICEACVRALPIDGASITMMLDVDRQEPICASDGVARSLDELQFSLGEGPCLTAFSSGVPVVVRDVAETDQRWPMFSEGAQQTPARAVYVFPLQLGAIKLGVLDLYSRTPGMLPDAQMALGLRAADAALWILLGRRHGNGSERVPPQWVSDYPLHRAEIHQATGMIVVQARVPVDTALALLRAFAFAHGRRLDEVARSVVTHQVRFDPERE